MNYVRMYVCMYMCVYVCMYYELCMYVCMYVCMGARWPLSQRVNAPVYAMYHFINKGLFLRK